MEEKTIKDLLEKKLKEFTFDYEDNDISGVMNLLDTEEDMQKMYDFIVDNNITDTDDIYEYGFELCDDLEEIDGVEEGSKVVDGVLGHAVGDALGTPVQFKDRALFYSNPVKNMMRSYGENSAIWSDDTAMELATMDSFIDKKKWDYDDIMVNFGDWLNDGKYTAHGSAFDVGTTCLMAIKNYLYNGTDALKSGLTGIRDNGNGSLMRILPVALYCYYKDSTKEEIYELTKNISSLTHGHEIAVLGCYIYVLFVINLLEDKDMYESYDLIKKEDFSHFSKASIDVYNRVLNKDIFDLSENDIKSSGYVVDSLEASLWCLLNTDNYKDALLTAVNLGGDTDTIAAITGSMAGIIYGRDSIPQEWLDKMLKVDYLIELSEKFESAIIY